jgi:hypothetical protein
MLTCRSSLTDGSQMKDQPLAVHRTIVVVDVEGFGCGMAHFDSLMYLDSYVTTSVH